MSVSTTTASSLHFLSLTPKTPLNSSNLNFVSFFPKIFTSTLSLSLSSSQTKVFEPASCSRLRVALDEDTTTFSSDLDEDEEEDDNRSFSPDLKLFVGNLPFNCDSAVLAGLFGRAGTVEMVEVIYDKITGRSRGFAFVTMSTVQEVEAAAQQFNGYELEGRALRVNCGPPPPREENSFRAPRGGAGAGGGGGGGRSFDNTNRLYVGNLSWDVDNVALETLFSEQGKVVDAKVVYDRETGRSRGFGFVTYGSSNEVNRAIDNLNGADLEGRQIRVSVAEAPPQRRY